MKKFFPVLKKSPLFIGIGDDGLEVTLGCLGGKIRKYKRNEAILSVGDSTSYIGIILSGNAQMMSFDYFGNRNLISSVGPSQIFAETFVCADVKRIPIDVIATEDTEVLFIDRERIICMCSKTCNFHRRMLFNLMKSISLKNLAFHQKLEIISKRSTREKLMSYLLSQAKLCGSNDFCIPFDRQGLADYLNVERSGLSAEIGKLRREGIIESRKNRFKLLVPDEQMQI